MPVTEQAHTPSADLTEFWQEMDEALRAEPEVEHWLRNQRLEKRTAAHQKTCVSHGRRCAFMELFPQFAQATGGALVGEG